MPDFWTHILGGHLILNNVDNDNWEKIVRDNRLTYNFGCQGPDFLFYNDFWPWVKNKRGPQIGTKLHQKNVQNFFVNSIDYLNQKKKHFKFPVLAAYLSGLIAHYAVDKTAHPFINARSNKFNEHKKLELNLDTYLMKKYRDKEAYRLSPTRVINLGKNLPPIIETYYQYILTQVHSHSEKSDFLNDSYRDFKFIFKLFYSPFRIKKVIFKLLNYVLPLDVSIFIYPKEEDYNLLSKEEFTEFEEILEAAVEEGTKLITVMNNYLNEKISKKELEKYFPEVSFEGIEG